MFGNGLTLYIHNCQQLMHFRIQTTKQHCQQQRVQVLTKLTTETVIRTAISFIPYTVSDWHLHVVY